jgi:hypothetical protein
MRARQRRRRVGFQVAEEVKADYMLFELGPSRPATKSYRAGTALPDNGYRRQLHRIKGFRSPGFALGHIDFSAGLILVQQDVVSGRIGKVTTEASNDEIPLDPVFAQLLLTWCGDRTIGLVFPSHVTGRSYHAGILQQKILRPKGAEIGIPKLGWHTFRHTCRSLLDEASAPIGIQQKLMRHSNVATTMFMATPRCGRSSTPIARLSRSLSTRKRTTM